MTRFIIIHELPEQLAEPISALRAVLAQQTGAVEALRYPVHLTLRTGLLCPDQAATTLAQNFLKFAQNTPVAQAKIKGVICSAYSDGQNQERGFLGLALAQNPDLLKVHAFLMNFKEYCKDPTKSFHPHISLLYHDISPAVAAQYAPEAEAFLAKTAKTWQLSTVSLWRQSAEMWNLVGRVACKDHA